MQKDYSVNYISVVVPVYNEEGCLQELIDRTLKTLDSTGKKFEFIFTEEIGVFFMSRFTLYSLRI